MIGVAVTYVAREGREEEVGRLFEELAVASRSEPGSRMYQPHRSAQDPRRFFLYELYTDDVALEAHRNSVHFRELAVEKLYPLLEDRHAEVFTTNLRSEIDDSPLG